MRIWPRSLFYRNLLLIVVLILLGQLLSALLFRVLVMKPRVQMTAQATAHHIEALQAALARPPRPQRQAFVAQLNAGTQAMPATDVAPRLMPRPLRLTSLEQAYIAQITQTLSSRGGEVSWRREPGRVLAVRIALGGEHYWLNVPGLVATQSLPRAWLAGSAITALLAIGGAWLIQRRLNQPLQGVIDAIRAVGRGEPPRALPETGPTEIATVARGFNDMVAGLARHEQERALMLAGLSHDLRTPLTKMRLACEMLQGQGDAALLASLDRNIEGLDHLLTQFLDFTRASIGPAGTVEVAKRLDVNALVREVVSQLTVGAAHPDILLDLPPTEPMNLPEQALRRVLLNLIANAQRHGAPPIEVAMSWTGQALCLEVRDRGPGIPPDQVDLVKQPFAQGNAARSHAHAGAGLGLAIVDRIVRAQGGVLELLPRVGGGLVARVVLQLGQGR